MVPTLELPFVIIPFFFLLFLLIPLLFHFSKLEILESSLNPACFYYSTQPTIKSYYFFLQRASSFTSSGLPSIPGHIPITATWIDRSPAPWKGIHCSQASPLAQQLGRGQKNRNGEEEGPGVSAQSWSSNSHFLQLKQYTFQPFGQLASVGQ